MFTLDFWKDAAERAIRTFAQTLGGYLIVDATPADIPWDLGLAASGIAALASVLMSVAGGGRGGSASLLTSGGGKHEA